MMSTATERQVISFEYVSSTLASGYFSLRLGDGTRTLKIAYDAVSEWE